MPGGLLLRVLPRFLLAYTVFFLRAFTDGRGSGALKGAGLFWIKLPKSSGNAGTSRKLAKYPTTTCGVSSHTICRQTLINSKNSAPSGGVSQVVNKKPNNPFT
jgi:hypothetical protein